MSQVLIVDDDKNFVPALARLVEDDGFSVNVAATLEEARARFRQDRPKVLLLDLKLPDGNGMELIEDINASGTTYDDTHVVVMTGYPEVDSAIGALRHRVDDYLVKPLSPTQILATLQHTNQLPAALPIPQEADQWQIIGRSPCIQELRGWLRRVAPSHETVFVHGETGTGKEVVARNLHHQSGRSGGFHAVNCGAIAPELIASELFGHERGSFTGASRRHRGLFERAEGGTLFLDEITEMPLSLQVHLLRVLETSSIVRVGSETQIDTDVRIVAATNLEPMQAVADNRLREDLYYRLTVLTAELSPLRQRTEDIADLAQHFMTELNREYNSSKRCDDEVFGLLADYDWPGNVRQLKHIIRRAFILSGEQLTPADFPRAWFASASNAGISDRLFNQCVGMSLQEMEKRLVLATLKHFDHDKKRVAQMLGVSLKTLYNRLALYSKAAV